MTGGVDVSEGVSEDGFETVLVDVDNVGSVLVTLGDVGAVLEDVLEPPDGSGCVPIFVLVVCVTGVLVATDMSDCCSNAIQLNFMVRPQLVGSSQAP